MDFIQSKEWMIKRIIDHIDQPAISDLLMKMVGDEESLNVATQQWLCKDHLIPMLVDRLSAQQDEEVHRNASQALVEIIMVSGQSPSVPLMNELQVESNVTLLLNHVLSGVRGDVLNTLGQLMVLQSFSSLEHGILVVIELLKRNMDIGEQRSNASPPVLVTSIINRLQDFAALLDRAPKTSAIMTSVGPVNPPVGSFRLRVIEFFVALVRTNYGAVDDKIIELNIVSKCLKMFFNYPWNNFLHQAVLDLIKTILQGPSDNLMVSVRLVCGSTLCCANAACSCSRER